MFIGIYFSQLGKDEETVISLCYDYADAFSEKFGSLSCYGLRPNGFTPDDLSHLCEKLTYEAVTFAYEFVKNHR